MPQSERRWKQIENDFYIVASRNLFCSCHAFRVNNTSKRDCTVHTLQWWVSVWGNGGRTKASNAIALLKCQSNHDKWLQSSIFPVFENFFSSLNMLILLTISTKLETSQSSGWKGKSSKKCYKKSKNPKNFNRYMEIQCRRYSMGSKNIWHKLLSPPSYYTQFTY